MITPRVCKAAIFSTALFTALCGATAAVAATGTRTEQEAVRDRIAAEYKADKEVCKSFSGNKKEICEDQALGREKVAKAEAEYNQTGKTSDRAKIAVAKADADLEVARSKCEDKLAGEKSVCRTEAKAAHGRALADAK